MVDFVDLPELILMCIFKNLPVWQLRLLALLCHKFNRLVKDDFRARTRLSLFCGSVVGKYDFIDVPDNWKFGLWREFDMVIRDVDERPPRENRHRYLTLSSDWVVHTRGQIALMVKSFPNVTSLTLVSSNNIIQRWCPQLIKSWPLKKLQFCPYVVRNLSEYFLLIDGMWDSVGRALLEQTQLEHLVFLPNVEQDFNPLYLDPLVRAGTLKTLIITDYTDTERVIALDNGGLFHINWADPAAHVIRTAWDGLEFADGIGHLESLGFNYYHLKNPITDQTLLSKIERVELTTTFPKFVRGVTPTTWTSLRVLALTIDEYNFARLFRKLSGLTHLEDLNLKVGIGEIFEKFDKLEKLPKLRTCRRWTKLPTVHRFQLSANMDAHEFVKMTHCFPNVDECSLKVATTIPRSVHRDQIIVKPLPVWDHFCSECSDAMIRAIEKYGTTNIQSFCWINRLTNDNNRVLIPKVQTFTRVDVGKTRLNFDYIPID